MKPSSPDTRCSRLTKTLKPNNLQILPCLHFPRSPLLFLFLLLLGLPGAPAALVRQRDEDLDVVEREESRLAVDHSFVPVLVDLIGQSDDVALVEAQLALVLRLKVVQGLAAGLLQG